MNAIERSASTQDPVAALAKERFGLDYLYPYQRLVMANVLEACGALRMAVGAGTTQR